MKKIFTAVIILVLANGLYSLNARKKQIQEEADLPCEKGIKIINTKLETNDFGWTKNVWFVIEIENRSTKRKTVDVKYKINAYCEGDMYPKEFSSKWEVVLIPGRTKEFKLPVNLLCYKDPKIEAQIVNCRNE